MLSHLGFQVCHCSCEQLLATFGTGWAGVVAVVIRNICYAYILTSEHFVPFFCYYQFSIRVRHLFYALVAKKLVASSFHYCQKVGRAFAEPAGVFQALLLCQFDSHQFYLSLYLSLRYHEPRTFICQNRGFFGGFYNRYVTKLSTELSTGGAPTLSGVSQTLPQALAVSEWRLKLLNLILQRTDSHTIYPSVASPSPRDQQNPRQCWRHFFPLLVDQNNDQDDNNAKDDQHLVVASNLHQGTQFVKLGGRHKLVTLCDTHQFVVADSLLSGHFSLSVLDLILAVGSDIIPSESKRELVGMEQGHPRHTLHIQRQ